MKDVILIHVAMKIECELLLNKLDILVKKKIYNYDVYEGMYKNNNIVVLVSGVGLVNTSSSLSLSIDRYKPRCVINIGLMGGYDKDLNISDIVIASRVMNINSYKTLYRNKGEGSNSLDWEYLTFRDGEDSLLLESANKELLELTDRVNISKNIGVIGSGDCWNNEIDKLLFMNKKYGILGEDMESIAVYSVCNKLNIPVISIKSVSNNLFNNLDYDRNSSNYVQEYLINYLEVLINK